MAKPQGQAPTSDPDDGEDPQPGQGQEPNVEPTGNQDGQEPESGTVDPQIAKLRQEAAKYRTERNELKERLDKIEADKEKREEERLAEQEKWQELAEKRQAEVEELKTKLQERDLQAQETRNRLAVQEAARAKGLDPKLAWRVVDHAAMEHDENGQPTNIDDLLDKAIETFGLQPADNGRGLTPGGIPPSPRAGGGSQVPDKKEREAAQKQARATVRNTF